MARQHGARTTMVTAFESTYGTPPASGFRRVPFASEDLDGAQELLPNELLGFGRDPLAPEIDVTNVNGSVQVPVDVRNFGNWLRLMFGAPVTTGAGPYTHVFSTGSWSLPSMAAEIQMPDIPEFNMLSGLKGNEISIPLTRKGFLNATIGLIGRSEAKATSTNAGSLSTDYALSRFLNRHGAITRDGTALANVTSATLKYMNNLDVIETIGDGGLIAGLDAGMASLTFDMTVRFANNDLVDQAIAGLAEDFVYTLTRAAGQTLTFTIPRLHLPQPKKAVTGPQGVEVTFQGIAAQASGGGAMMTATLVNDIASYA